ncbi:MAG: hypothetical protein IT381_10760 [Deltaproteobacteria bacterium]|nr:hypothetical protein [Deltaproteobacteria bacterium]
MSGAPPKKPPPKPGAKAAAPPPPPEPPPPPKPADQIEKPRAFSAMDKIGSKAGPAPSAQDKTYEVLAAPAAPPADHGVKDAERLKIVSRGPTLVQAERQWLEKLQAKLMLGAPIASKKLGFGLWKKKHETKAQLAEALGQTVAPIFAKIWQFEMPAFAATEDEAIFQAPLVEVSGEPPLHPSYANDTRAYALNIHQDDVRHVAHGYVMALAHVWFRALIALKRSAGADAAVQASGLNKEQLYALEVNFCQYYVPSSLVAYFEAQPLRALAREIANRFRKVAFGGQ